MKKIFLLLCSLIAAYSMVSCTPDFVLNVADLPKDVLLTAYPDQDMIIAGSENFMFTHIRDTANNEVPAQYNSFNYTATAMDWLVVKCNKGSNSIILSASPNNTPFERTLYVGVSNGKNSGEIKVSQRAGKAQ
jgi:hypothetical protein